MNQRRGRDGSKHQLPHSHLRGLDLPRKRQRQPHDIQQKDWNVRGEQKQRRVPARLVSLVVAEAEHGVGHVVVYVGM